MATGTSGADPSEWLPLSAAQHGIWLGQQLDPESPAYWAAEAVQLSGALDVEHLVTCIADVLGECDALHYRFREVNGHVVQLRDATAAVTRQVDFSDAADPQAAADHWMARQGRDPVDLANGPLFASTLLRLGPQRHAWHLRAHHIALDGLGFHRVIRRVAQHYGGRVATDTAWHLGPVIAEDLEYQQSAARQRDRQFWMSVLQHATPAATVRPAAPLAPDVRRLRAKLDQAMAQRWQAASRDAGVDWPAWVIAVIATWVQRVSGISHVTFGLPVMAPPGSRAASVPCMAMNIVAVPVHIDARDTVHTLARQVAQTLRRIRPHQRYRYEHLKNDLDAGPGRQRLFGPVINVLPFADVPDFGEIAAVPQPLNAGPVEDIAITVAMHRHGLRLDLEANPLAYSDADLSGLHSHLHALFDDACGAAGLAVASDGRRLAVSAGTTPFSAPPVLDRLRQNAAQTPSHRAIEQAGTDSISYASLVDRVRNVAGHLHTVGITKDSLVAVLLPRSIDAIVAQLAVLWAGGAYLPLDPDGPPERIATVLSDARPSVSITYVAFQHRWAMPGTPILIDTLPPQPAAMLPEPVPAGTDALAYVIYTSGSTGRPNGVMVDRGALDHFVAAAADRYAIRSDDRILQFAPLQFDASVEEIYLALTVGATLVLRPPDLLTSLDAFGERVEALGVTVLDLPTAFWHEWVAALDGRAPPASLRGVIIGGEAALPARVSQWRRFAGAVRLVNSYGPTECTVVCTTATLTLPHRDEHADAVPIGQPLPGVTLAVVDDFLQPVEIGEAGELCIVGPTLARGYHDRATPQRERFITLCALPGAPRAYRTGDRVRMAEDGTVHYLCRRDDELKISGHRVDPREIEAALAAIPGVHEAAVVALDTRIGKMLHAFLTGPIPLATATLRAALGQCLLDAAMPSAFHWEERLPRDANGKIDRRTLRALASRASEPPSAATDSGIQTQVLDACRAALGHAQLGIDDDFFAAGGRSLHALRAAHDIARRLALKVSAAQLYQFPTPRQLAQHLVLHDGTTVPGNDPLAPLLTLRDGKGAALFCIHPADGLGWCYFGLLRHLPDVPIHAIQARGLSGELPGTYEAMVEDYVRHVRHIQPSGPYHLLGWSSGGGVAHAVACRLRALGEPVAMLAMLDAYPSEAFQSQRAPTRQDALLAMIDNPDATLVTPDGTPLDDTQLMAQVRAADSSLAGFDIDQLQRMADVALHHMQQYRTARHEVFDGDLLHFRAARRPPGSPDWEQWRPYVRGTMACIDVDCTHRAMCQPASLTRIGACLLASLRNAARAGAGMVSA
ncbi:amino acid adenylation domain-containing protein [Tahibacter amnicola]|uniref:Amino acid adenylation domain-containing protein n=1 Tax=Tahibacter amnicola TaxID=2976241 RepID=A0ABY6BA06_9GAMM|nr:amino acid adenylation domain-containing protein [Tahibacter amnicola]UXI66617.1 amino acid adenylation domain-containing protein [Tahibacter amnicola]